MVRWRIGGHVNATLYLTKYEGGEWSASHKWNHFKTTSGVYASFGIYNGKMHAAWSRRMRSDHDQGYRNNRGLFYGYSEAEDGLSDWVTSDGLSMGFPLNNQNPFKLADPSRPGQSVSRSPAFIVTENGAFHAHTQVDRTIRHYYRPNADSNLTSSDGGPDGNMYSIGVRVYSISLRNGRPAISSTAEGTFDWREEFIATSGKRFTHGNSILVDDSIYYYLMETGSGIQRPIQVLRFDIFSR